MPKTPAANRWVPTSLYIADDFVHADGTLDTAGDFAAAQDLVVVGDPAHGISPLQSPQLPATRLYYDPRPGGVSDPWRQPDAVQVRLRVIEAFQQGPSLVVYNGHSNQFQWASTVRSLENPYLFGTNDIYVLHNLDRLPLVLEMTVSRRNFRWFLLRASRLMNASNSTQMAEPWLFGVPPA